MQKDILVFCFIMFALSVYYGIVSCLPIAYKGKYPSQLSNRERRIQNGTATIVDKFTVFYLNTTSNFLYPPILIMAAVIFVIYKIFVR